MANLLSNAVKFTEQGAIELSARPEGDAVRIEVRDTGPGIAPEDFEHLFKPFMQVGDTRRHHREGTGLGLAISRHLARALGGDIAIESELGRGTRFIVSLPRASGDAVDAPGATGLFRRLSATD